MDQITVIPWEIVQGSTGIFGPVAWETGAPVALVNLTGCTAICDIRDSPTGPVLLTVSTTLTSSGQVILGGPAGTVEVILSPTATMLLPAGSAGDVTSIWGKNLVYQITVTFSTGQIWVFARGSVRVRAEV